MCVAGFMQISTSSLNLISLLHDLNYHNKRLSSKDSL
jgi:hypothetical protein